MTMKICRLTTKGEGKDTYIEGQEDLYVPPISFFKLSELCDHIRIYSGCRKNCELCILPTLAYLGLQKGEN